MEANFNIEPELLKNEDQFQEEFFQRFTLRKAPEPLQLNEEISKHYSFPTFYNDVTCAIAIYFCNYQKALALMPHASMRPVPATRGRAVVILSCYQYKKVYNVAPYNEIAMTIPIMTDGATNPPLLPLVMKSFSKFGYYVFSMPVTSHENKIRGRKIWGLPKVTERIDMDIANETCTTVAFDENNQEYFRLSVPTIGSDQLFDETGNLYSVLDGQRLKSATNFYGRFKVNKNPSMLWKKNVVSNKKPLVLGDSPRAETLKSLELESIPFQFRFAETMYSCFDLAAERKPL